MSPQRGIAVVQAGAEVGGAGEGVGEDCQRRGYPSSVRCVVAIASVLLIGCGSARTGCDAPLPRDQLSSTRSCAVVQIQTDRKQYQRSETEVAIHIAGEVQSLPCSREVIGPCSQPAVQIEDEQHHVIWKNTLLALSCPAPPPPAIGTGIRANATASGLVLKPGVYRITGQPGYDLGQSYFQVC